jgi:succinate dehydrogenase hydrophobic anchor subunit
MTAATKSERESVQQARQEIKEREAAEKKGGLANLWANYNLTIVLIVMTIVTLVLHAMFGWAQYVADQASHGQDATLWGPDGYWIYFGEWTMQNWQSEFVQSLVIVTFSAWFVHKGSGQSKDSDQEMQLALNRIEERLGQLEERKR